MKRVLKKTAQLVRILYKGLVYGLLFPPDKRG
jgi:hypothetical protein